MAGKGPKKTPTRILELRGSPLAKRRQGEVTPAALEDVPPCPDRVQGKARELWESEAPTMVAVGTLTALDLHTFERWCRIHALWTRQAEQMLEADVITEGSTRTLANLDNALRKLETAFGRSPADRAGLNVAAPESARGNDPFRKPPVWQA